MLFNDIQAIVATLVYNILNVGLNSSDLNNDGKVIWMLLVKMIIFGFIYSFHKYNMLAEFY